MSVACLKAKRCGKNILQPFKKRAQKYIKVLAVEFEGRVGLGKCKFAARMLCLPNNLNGTNGRMCQRPKMQMFNAK